MWTCPECGEQLEDQFRGACWKCANDGVEIVQKVYSLAECVEGLTLSSTAFLPGSDIKKSLGIVSGVGIILGSNLMGAVNALLLATADTYEEHFKSAQNTAIAKMALEAKTKSADGIVGINISCHNIGEKLLMVTATGTAVTVSASKY
jgi:uncharacterized protein YbjQ (UPF0145 family)